MVSIDRDIYDVNFDMVGLDNKQSAILIVNHLLSQNMKDILFITGKIDGILSRKQRVEVIQSMFKLYPDCVYKTIELKNIEDETYLDKVISQFYSRQIGKKKVIISVNGMTTLNIALSFKRLNLQCGSDIGLIGLDDPVWFPVTFNGISSVKQPMFEMGYISLMLLLKRINGDNSPPKTLLYPGELIIRHSIQN